MQPASPSVVSPARGAGPVALRGMFALLLALLVSAVMNAQPTAAGAAQPTKKETDKKEPDKKEPEKKEYVWPTQINGKDIKAVIKDLKDLDPVNREYAARTLPNFGPAAQKKEVSQLLLDRMQAEPDPGVRFAVYTAIGSIAFDDDKDNKEALRLLALVVDTPVGPTASTARYNAVQTIAMFGPRGYETITKLTGVAASDPSHETRRVIASTLGRVASHPETGPNMRAMRSLADHFSRDPSAAVRMEALQSLMLLGPPWADVKKKDAKENPPIKVKEAEEIVKFMKVRVGDPKLKTTGLEKDKQVEIWARLVLMRFDPKEINEDNLEAFAKHLSGGDIGVKVQALQAIAMMGELAGKKVDSVARLLEDKALPMQLTLVTVQTLAAMGAGAKPAIPKLKEFLTEVNKTIDKLKDEEGKMKTEMNKIAITDVEKKKEAENALKGKEYERKTGEEVVKLIESVIKHIDAAKPTSPSETPKKP